MMTSNTGERLSSAVVVGGGLGGLAAAGLLARSGLRVTLLEAVLNL
jgi:phytoene dehydrogenase-like protein